jgi:hypothetical protein
LFKRPWPPSKEIRMNYLSTRGDATPRKFCEILLEGLAPDGGLYLPEKYPQVDDATLTRWRKVYRDQGYAELAFEILSLYIDDIPADDLRAICQKTYTAEVFGTGEIVPLRHLEDGLGSRPCPTARRWPSRTWRCSCWATCSNTSWRAAAKRSTSSAPPAATPAARPNTRCAAKRACACS